jgi:hypothetical protein
MVPRQVAMRFMLVSAPTYEWWDSHPFSSRKSRTHAPRLPKYLVVPDPLLGRLAVDIRHAGRGLGETLLIDPLRRSL